MAHNHPIIDVDTHFKIDGATRVVKNEAETKAMLVQFDHKSERFTFEVPRFVDGHDLSLCNLVRVHYINIEKSRRTENKGCTELTDLEVCPEDDNIVTCSWLVPRDATQLVGSLHFVIQFACIDGNEIVYSWNTAKHTSVSITDGIDGGEGIVEEYIDILTKWKNQLEANQITKMEQTKVSTADNGENIWTATFGDGRTQELKVRNGSRGATGLIGSIETIQGNPLHFFVGTQEEYNALSDEDKVNLFAIITDDTSTDDILKTLEDLMSGKIIVPKAHSLDPSSKRKHLSRLFNVYKFNSDQYYSVAPTYQTLTEYLPIGAHCIVDIYTTTETDLWEYSSICHLNYYVPSNGTGSGSTIYEIDIPCKTQMIRLYVRDDGGVSLTTPEGLGEFNILITPIT